MRRSTFVSAAILSRVMDEIIKSTLVSLQGNHRKASKLLGLAMQQQPPDKITPRLASYFENNLGCLHLMMSKPNLAVFYFNRALQHQLKQLTEMKAQRVIPKEAALQIKKTEVVYNLGLALLHAGQPDKAFKSFSSCLPGNFAGVRVKQRI